MDSISLCELENTANQAYQEYWAAQEAYQAAIAHKDAVQDVYYEKMNKYIYGDGDDVQEQAMANAAAQELENALTEAARCEEELAAATEAAQAAQEAVETRKNLLRLTARLDTTFAVYCARIECTCGMRSSYILLMLTHGVYTRQLPQLTAGDVAPGINIPSFGGCRSLENPALKAAAEEAAQNANKAIAKENTLIDKIVKCFCGGGKVEVTDSLMEKCMGVCTPSFPEGAEWKRGHEKVFVNGEPVLMRRCTLRCDYGGQITILLSGQPE